MDANVPSGRLNVIDCKLGVDGNWILSGSVCVEDECVQITSEIGPLTIKIRPSSN
jgi:hypothetical protein